MKILLHYIKPYSIYFILACLTIIISSFTILAFGQGLQHLITSGLETFNPEIINKSLLILLIMILIISITSFFRMWLTSYASDKVIGNIRCSLYNEIIFFKPSFFEKNSISSVMDTLMIDTTVLQSMLSANFSVMLRNFSILLGSIVMLLYTNIKLTIYTTLIVPIIMFLIIAFSKKVKSLSKLSHDSVSKISSFAEESYRGIAIVQSFTSEEYSKEKFYNLVEESIKITAKHNFLRSLLITLIITLAMTSIGLVVWLGIHEVFNNNLNIGSLTSFMFYSFLSIGSINNLGYNINCIQKVRSISANIAKIINYNNIKNHSYNKEINEFKENISIKNLTFYYPSKLHYPALYNISFTINKGETVALVGPSGSGKSTLINMLMRFHEPSRGSIYIDGIDIKSISLHNLRSLFGLIPQDPIIFSGTILDNISYGGRCYDFEEIVTAAKNAGALDFIENFPNKFNTYVGERGLCLSEGQKQRIVIARALLRNSDILILDEATSSLDSENELFIHDALKKFTEKKTVLIIAHRLSTIINSDRIVVINNGIIQEIGTHKTLMEKKDSLYAKLAKLQFL